MEIVVLDGGNKGNYARISELLRIRNPEDTVISLTNKNDGELLYAIKRENPDLIVTFDLQGFEISTLTGGIAYNLLNGKFVHFMLHDQLPNEKYLKKQLSISMFFYCAGHDYYRRLKQQYPHIPYLKELSNDRKEQGTEEGIIRAVRTVIDEIKKSMQHIDKIS